jgi:hypothetical protein
MHPVATIANEKNRRRAMTTQTQTSRQPYARDIDFYRSQAVTMRRQARQDVGMAVLKAIGRLLRKGHALGRDKLSGAPGRTAHA